MKKPVSVALLLTLIFSACIPSFAQKARAVSKQAGQPVSKVDSVLFDNIDALTEGNGVVLRWQTKSETRNVGFYAYRLSKNGRELVNPVMELGSAAKAGFH